MFCSASSPPDLNPFEHVFHLLKAKLSKQELKTALKKKKKKKGLTEHHQGRNPGSGNVYGFQMLLDCPVTFSLI